MQQALVDQLKQQGYIYSPSVELAFRKVPRHIFLSEASLDDINTAYRDEAIAIYQSGVAVSSASQPSLIALMLEQLDLKSGHKVLEIGTGTGYNTALMAEIVGTEGKVVSLDINQRLVEKAHQHLTQAEFDGISVLCSDGGLGYPDLAPYDRIISTVAVWDITPAWYEQLHPEGKLLIPLSLRGQQVLAAFRCVDDHLESIFVDYCQFMRIVGFSAEPSTQASWTYSNFIWQIWLPGCCSLDGSAMRQLLLQGGRVIPAIRILSTEYFSLCLWLSTHESNFCTVDILTDDESQSLYSTAVGLATKQSLCLLSRVSSGQSASMDLELRSYGEEGLDRQMIQAIRAWEAAGRPSLRDVKIKACPIGSNHTRSKCEQVIAAQHTEFIIKVC
jgi:protein-L-isoaspartate(D-aspartate) O-methyltransferase